MTYKFLCNKCNQQHYIDMRLTEYHADNHYCPTCNTEMIRDITDISGGSIWKCSGAYGKSNL